MNEKIKQALEKLSPEEKELVTEYLENVRENAIRGAAGGIMARNFSHGIGRHALEKVRTKQ